MIKKSGVRLRSSDTESWRSGSSDRGSPNQVPDHQAKSMDLDTGTGLWSQESVSQRLGTGHGPQKQDLGAQVNKVFKQSINELMIVHMRFTQDQSEPRTSGTA
jgi:hypothetical protein